VDERNGLACQRAVFRTFCDNSVARLETCCGGCDMTEFIEFCIGCRMAPPAALVELMKLRR
jgi:hypothetical protein